jgi:hypothetical protein
MSKIELSRFWADVDGLCLTFAFGLLRLSSVYLFSTILQTSQASPWTHDRLIQALFCVSLKSSDLYYCFMVPRMRWVHVPFFISCVLGVLLGRTTFVILHTSLSFSAKSSCVYRQFVLLIEKYSVSYYSFWSSSIIDFVPSLDLLVGTQNIHFLGYENTART